MALIFGVIGLTGCVAIDEVTFQFHDDSPEAIESNWRDYKRGKVDFSRGDCDRWQRRFHDMLKEDSK